MADAFERAAERAETESRQRRRERWAHGHRKGFRIHATVFVAVQILIFAVWVLQWQLGGTGYPWFIYPLLGWGIGLAAHYAAVHDSFKDRGRSPSAPKPQPPPTATEKTGVKDESKISNH